MFLTSGVLQRFRLLGLRNGLWRSLGPVEQALYRASIIYANVKGRIVNARLLELLNGLIERLRMNVQSTILALGRFRAKELGEAYSRRGVFAWCPSLRGWLEDVPFQFFLAVTWKNTGAMFRNTH